MRARRVRRRKRIKKTNPYDNSALSLESCTPPLFAVMQRQRWSDASFDFVVAGGGREA